MDDGVYVGLDMTRKPEENRTELRPGFVDPADTAPEDREYPDVPIDVAVDPISDSPLTEIDE